MLAAKFIPGLTTVMPPLAGVFAITRMRFALYDFAGVLLWAGTWLALGYFFSDAIVLIAVKASAFGRVVGLVIVTALIWYILVKYGRRRLFLRQIQTIRVSPVVFKRRLGASYDVTGIDRPTTELRRLSERAPPSRSSAPRRFPQDSARGRDVVAKGARPERFAHPVSIPRMKWKKECNETTTIVPSY